MNNISTKEKIKLSKKEICHFLRARVHVNVMEANHNIHYYESNPVGLSDGDYPYPMEAGSGVSGITTNWKDKNGNYVVVGITTRQFAPQSLSYKKGIEVIFTYPSLMCNIPARHRRAIPKEIEQYKKWFAIIRRYVFLDGLEAPEGYNEARKHGEIDSFRFPLACCYLRIIDHLINIKHLQHLWTHGGYQYYPWLDDLNQKILYAEYQARVRNHEDLIKIERMKIMRELKMYSRPKSIK